ncbi:MAG TPA: DUF2179 domain-containing protein [Longimicrobiales bacterium]
MSTLDTIFAGPWGPLCIFLLRIGDVSLATLRILLSMRNARLLVPVIGFFEVLIWIFAVGNAIRNLNSPLHLLGYAGGFATGNLVGLWLEEKLAIGMAVVRVVSRYGGVELAEALREKGFGATEFAGQGRDGTVEIVDTVVRRRDVPAVLREIDRWDPQAFVMIEEPRSIRHGQLAERPRERIPVPFGRVRRRTAAPPQGEEASETPPRGAPESSLDPAGGAND